MTRGAGGEMLSRMTGRFFALLLSCLLAAACRGGERTAAGSEAPPARAAEAAPAPPVESARQRAARVHREAFVFDAHADTLMRVVDDGYDLGALNDTGHVDLPRLKEGGVDAQVFAVWVDPEAHEGGLWRRAVAMIDAFHRQLAEHSDRVGLARDAGDARRLAATGRLAAFLGLEGGYALEGDLDRLAWLRERGLRYVTLTWWGPSDLGDGSGAPPKWNGLSDLGRRAVGEMERLGITVDVSHASDETFFEVLGMATRPVIASHSGARAVAEHHRNLSDEMLRALAKNGGVVGITFVAAFLDEEHDRAAGELRERLKPEFDRIERKHRDDPRRRRKERWALWGERARAELPPVSLEMVIDHIEHAVKVAGVDHVGLGSDFDGFSVGPVELADCGKYPLITSRLLARGFSEEDVRKILGGNFLRVFGEGISDR